MKLRATILALVAWAALLFAPPIHAQGCAQCRDNTAATTPATQRAYRHAIILMAGTASAVFLTTLVMLRKKR